MCLALKKSPSPFRRRFHGLLQCFNPCDELRQAADVDPQFHILADRLGRTAAIHFAASQIGVHAGARGEHRMITNGDMAGDAHLPGTGDIVAQAGAAGNANQAFSNLAGQEAQQQAGVLDNLSRAYAMSINEGDKVQANKLMKYQLDSQAQSALRESESCKS